MARRASRSEALSFSVADFSCPQAARMSRPRGVRIGLAADGVVNHLPIARPEAQPADIYVYVLVASIGGLSGLVYWLIAVRHRQIAER